MGPGRGRSGDGGEGSPHTLTTHTPGRPRLTNGTEDKGLLKLRDTLHDAGGRISGGAGPPKPEGMLMPGLNPGGMVPEGIPGLNMGGGRDGMLGMGGGGPGKRAALRGIPRGAKLYGLKLLLPPGIPLRLRGRGGPGPWATGIARALWAARKGLGLLGGLPPSIRPLVTVAYYSDSTPHSTRASLLPPFVFRPPLCLVSTLTSLGVFPCLFTDIGPFLSLPPSPFRPLSYSIRMTGASWAVSGPRPTCQMSLFLPRFLRVGGNTHSPLPSLEFSIPGA